MKRSKFLLIFGGAFFLFGLLFSLLGLNFIRQDARFESEGIKTMATVISKRIEEEWDSKNKRHDRYYHLTYSFTPEGGAAIEGDGLVGSELYAQIESGQSIEVQYLPGQPEKNRLTVSDEKTVGYIFFGMGSLLCLIGGAVLFYDIKARIRARRLLQTGALTGAKVVGVEHSNLTINNVKQWQIRYSYKDTMGRTHEGTSETMSPTIANEWKEGDTGQIRYDKNKPEQSLWLGKPM